MIKKKEEALMLDIENTPSEKTKEEKSNKPFLQTKYLFLTYAQTPEDWTKEKVRDTLLHEILVYTKGKNRFDTKVTAYIIAEERHKEPRGKGEYERGGKHFHCLLELKKRTKIPDERFLDIDGHHGNYQSAGNPFSVLNYCKKDGNYLSEGFPGLKSKVKNVIEAETELDAKLMIAENMGAKDLINLRALQLMQRSQEEFVKKTVLKMPEFPFQQLFKPYTKESGFHHDDRRPMGIMLFGEPESGKTSFAYKMGLDLGYPWFEASDLKEFEHYSQEELIIFDEITQEVLEGNSSFFARVISQQQARTLPYYGTKTLNPTKKVFFTTNADVLSWNYSDSLLNRLIFVQVFSNGEYQFWKWKNNHFERCSPKEYGFFDRNQQSLDEFDIGE